MKFYSDAQFLNGTKLVDEEGNSIGVSEIASKDYVSNLISSVKIVSVTQSEYDSLTTKEENTLYLITD